MKILFLQNIDGVAGSEKYFLALIPELIKKGADVEMYCVIKKQNIKKAQKFIDLLKTNQIPYSVLHCKSYGSLVIPKTINNYIKKNQFDIIHTHLIYADFWGAMIKKFFNKKIIIVSTKHGYHETTYVKYCNNPEQLPKNLYYRLFKFTHKHIDYSYACSYGLRDFYEIGNLIKKGSMDVIQHGFNYPDIKDFEEKNYRYSKHQLIIVGRLIERKGHHFVLDILGDLISEFPDLQLLILGSGEMEENLKALSRTLNLNDHVKFLGFKLDVEKYLAASDVSVVPSYSEGLPLVIFEAFNAKTPVVAFDSIGCNELIINEETGLIAKAFSKTDLRDKIITLLKNKDLQQKVSKNGYNKLKSYFSLNRMTEDTFNYYKKILHE
ncbi:MAG: glycosyltransferase family 4 protein [Putridiphycobacter sp.]